MGKSQSNQGGTELDSLTEPLTTKETNYFLDAYTNLRKAGPVEPELERALLVQHFIELIKRRLAREALVAAREYLVPFRDAYTRLATADGRYSYIRIQEVLGLLCYEEEPGPALQPLLSAAQRDLVFRLLSRQRKRGCCKCFRTKLSQL